MGIRKPIVADRFYPGDRGQLNSTVNNLLESFHPPKKAGVIGAVSPHAGYIYSGAVCAETLKSIEIPETVIILGPNHHGQGADIALSKNDWEMPGGTVPINDQLADLLLSEVDEVEIDELAHRYEHSLEVQVPFLQALQKNITIVPIVLSQLSFSLCERLAEGLAQAVINYGMPVLLLASSDMNHYESREDSNRKDRMALENITAMNPLGLYQTILENRITMCGMIPVTVVLQASILLGANTGEVVRYTDSGDVSGDTSQVVGYAGAVIAKA